MASSEIVGNYVFDMAPAPAHSQPAGPARRSSGSSSKHQPSPPSSRRGSIPQSSRTQDGSRAPLRHQNADSRAVPQDGAPQLQRTTSPEATLPPSDAEHYTRHSEGHTHATGDHASTSHVKSNSPKLTRLSSALSFFRTNRRSSTPSTDSDHESHSGTSDGESDSSMRSWTNQLRIRSRAPQAVAPPPRPAYKKSDLKKALIFARGEIVKQVEASGKNALIVEGWAVTVLRQGSRYRLQIEYTARPAVVSYPDQPRLRRPPYLEVIDS